MWRINDIEAAHHKRLFTWILRLFIYTCNECGKQTKVSICSSICRLKMILLLMMIINFFNVSGRSSGNHHWRYTLSNSKFGIFFPLMMFFYRSNIESDHITKHSSKYIKKLRCHYLICFLFLFNVRQINLCIYKIRRGSIL